MKKKIILSIFLLAMLVSVFALTVGAMELGNYYDVSENESSNVSARLEENRECAGTYTLYISGNGEMRDFSRNDTPWHDFLDKITVVKIGRGVTYIGAYSFEYCTNLKTVIWEEGLLGIGVYAFHFTGIEAISIPDSVTTIGSYAFNSCNSLKAVYVPGTVSKIGANTFTNCDKATIYSSATSKVYGWASTWDDGDSKNVWRHTHSYSDFECVCGDTEYIEKLDVSSPDYFGSEVIAYLFPHEEITGKYSVRFIGRGYIRSFYENSKYEDDIELDLMWMDDDVISATMSEDIHNIPSFLLNFTGITEFHISRYVRVIEPRAFESCRSLKNITVDEYNNAYRSKDGILFSFDYETLVYYPQGRNDESYVVPNGVVELAEGAFIYTKVKHVYLPNGLEVIGEAAFALAEIETMNIPTTVKTIGDYGFYSSYEMYGCFIPATVEYIGKKCFTYFSVINVYCEVESKPTEWDEEWAVNVNVHWGHTHNFANYECYCGANQYVAKWNVSATDADSLFVYLFEDFEYEGRYILQVSGEGYMKSFTNIEGVAYDRLPDWTDDKKISKVIIKEGVCNVGSWAFRGLDITELHLPSTLVYFEPRAFEANFNLASITVDENNRKYKSVDGVLYSYDGKTLVKYPSGKQGNFFALPNDVEVIEHFAFAYASALKEITFSPVLKSIGKCSFALVDLNSLTFPDTLESIEKFAFGYSDFLTPIYISSEIDFIGERAFGYSTTQFVYVYCDAEAKPENWHDTFAGSCAIVTWGHSHTYDGYFCECGAAKPYIMKWDVSATENDRVFAYLYENEQGYYTLLIDGYGNMMDYEWYADSPWFSDYRKQVSQIIFGEEITGIGKYAFWEFELLTNVVFPEGLTKIGERAFNCCYSITEFEIGPNVTEIGMGAFWTVTTELQRFIVDTRNESYIAINGVLYTIDQKILIQYPAGKEDKYFDIPKTVTELSAGAFAYTILEELVIPDSVNSIHRYFIEGNYAIKKLVIPSSVTYMEQMAIITLNNNLVIYCEAFEEPDGWVGGWNWNDLPVVWAYGHEHSYDYVTVAPTCTVDGYTEYTCACGDGYTVVAAALGHTFGDPVNVDASTHTRECYCGTVIAESHSYTPWSEVDETTMIRSCACGKTEYLEVEIEDDKVNTKPNKVDKDKEKDKVNIDIVFDKNTFESVGVELTPEILGELNNMETSINTDIGSIILDAIASSKVAEQLGNVSIGISDITTDKEEQTGHKVFSITVNDENGDPILPPSSDDNGTVTLSVKYQKGLLKEQVKIAYRDENGKLEYMQVEKYDPETGEVTFKTNHLSDYVIYSVEIDPEECLANVFKFKGYSFNASGSMAVGYSIDYEAKALYEKVTGKTLKIGVLFAGYDNLDGKQPLDSKGNPIELTVGRVAVASLTGYDYFDYDFVLTDIIDSIKDVSLVISAYLNNGEETRYVQANGLSNSVYGITYNEISGPQIITDENGLKYEINDNELTVVGIDRVIDDTILLGIDIPNSYNGMEVVAIGALAFAEFGTEFCKTEYGNVADFVEIRLPQTVKAIGEDAFANCNNIEVVACDADGKKLTGDDLYTWDQSVDWGTSKNNRQARDTVWGFRPAIGWTRYSMTEIPDWYE